MFSRVPPLPFTAQPPTAWPLPWVLALVIAAMILFAVLGVRDLLGARDSGERADEDDRRPPSR